MIETRQNGETVMALVARRPFWDVLWILGDGGSHGAVWAKACKPHHLWDGGKPVDREEAACLS